MSKELAIASLRILVAARTITEAEYDANFLVIERSPTNQHITIAQLAHLVATGAAFYKQSDD